MRPPFQSEREGISSALNACDIPLLGVHASACFWEPAEAGTPNDGPQFGEGSKLEIIPPTDHGQRTKTNLELSQIKVN